MKELVSLVAIAIASHAAASNTVVGTWYWNPWKTMSHFHMPPSTGQPNRTMTIRLNADHTLSFTGGAFKGTWSYANGQLTLALPKSRIFTAAHVGDASGATFVTRLSLHPHGELWWPVLRSRKTFSHDVFTREVPKGFVSEH